MSILRSGLTSPSPLLTDHRLKATPAALCTIALLLAGCGTGSVGTKAPAGQSPAGSAALSGTAYGGQQPISNADIALYAAGKTGLYSAPRSMLTTAVSTDSTGHFSIPAGDYSCQAGDQVYIVATGGSAGSGANPAIVLMSVLGPCSGLSASTQVNINEVSTVASVYVLSAFMSGVNALGSTADTLSTDTLAGAFANFQTMADPVSGTAYTTSTGAGMVPTATINSLGNSLAACVNSAGSTSTACSDLFSDTTVTGSTPTTTLQAALNLAHYPTTNTTAVFTLGGSSPPFEPTLSAAPSSYTIVVAHPSDALTYHNANSRDGAQTSETILTPANVNSTQFGKLFTFTVDSYLFAQPLYIGGIGMPDGVVHNIVVAASTHGTVYAFDADGNNPAAGHLWSVSYLPSGERYPTSSDYGGCSNPPEAGIVGTPVIDRSTQTIYFVTKTITSTGSTFYHRLHAVSLLDGLERSASPTVINPTFAGDGAGATSGSIPFSGERQSQRSALMLVANSNGSKTVWIPYASHCDAGPYHGLVLGFDGSSMAATATFNDTPNGDDGGIWGSNGGLAADSSGYVYAAGGNGTFDANTSGPDYGDTALKLSAPASGASSTAMTVTDYFTPSNQANLQSTDGDLGGAVSLLISDPASGVAPQVMLSSDKNGYIYLINTANMGKYDTGTHGISSLNGDIQDFQSGGTFIYNFAFFNNYLYTSNNIKAYPYTPGTSSTAGSLSTTATATASIGSSAPVVSANGTTNAIVWGESTSAVLYAYTAPSLTQIYSSNTNSSRDAAPTFVKFTSPVIANGKVYLSGQGSLDVYGLLP